VIRYSVTLGAGSTYATEKLSDVAAVTEAAVGADGGAPEKVITVGEYPG